VVLVGGRVAVLAALSPQRFVSSAAETTTPAEATVFVRSKIGPIILIVLGALFLLSNLGFIPQLRHLLSQWWPLILIAVGVFLLARR
jgi:hypothetical protein